jgi:ribose 5-phosphate isomerase B
LKWFLEILFKLRPEYKLMKRYRARQENMPSANEETRERVRELVRHVLKTVPVEPEEQPADLPRHVVVNSLQDKLNREFDRDESSKSLITEADLRGLEPGSRVRVAEQARLTPLAQDIVNDKNIELIRKQSRDGVIKVKTVAVGADHGGFPVKEALKLYLEGLGLNVRDMGTNSTDPVDYPDYAHAVARAVSDKQTEIGIIVDGAGIGSAMAANKVPNIRAAACYSAALAKNSREHNGANVLTLGSGQNSIEEIKEIVHAFLNTEIAEDRHKKRVAKIDNIEQQYKK